MSIKVVRMDHRNKRYTNAGPAWEVNTVSAVVIYSSSTAVKDTLVKDRLLKSYIGILSGVNLWGRIIVIPGTRTCRLNYCSILKDTPVFSLISRTFPDFC